MGSFSFSGWQENLRPLLTCDPAVYGTRQNLTLCLRAQHLDISTCDDDFTTFLYDLTTFSLHSLGSAPWCSRYGSHVNEPIPISLYLYFLSRMVVGSIEDLPR
jgi:hypothetical protein